MTLAPYVKRHKGELFLGMLTQIGMGISGTLLPLILGVIVDCIKGAAEPLAQLGKITHVLLGFLLPYYHPKDGHSLAIFCSALIIICAIQGAFSYWTRQILIGLSRDIEYDLRNDLLTKLVVMEPEFYVRNRTGELMSRCTNDLNSVRMVLGSRRASVFTCCFPCRWLRLSFGFLASRFTLSTEKFRRRSRCFPPRPRRI